MNDVLVLLQAKLRTLMNERADHIATGGAADFAEYRELVGIVKGLALAERELLDLSDAVGESED
jgi:hypothetical protein